MTKPDARLRRWGFIIAASLAALVVVTSAVAISTSAMQAQRQEQLLDATNTALVTLGNVHADAGEVQAGAYDYTYSGDAAGRDLYQTSRVQLISDTQSLAALPPLSTDVKQDVSQIQGLVAATLADLQSVVDLRLTGQTQPAIQVLTAGPVDPDLAALHNAITHLTSVLKDMVHARLAATDTAELVFNAVLIVAAVVDILSLIAILILIRRTAAMREQLAAAHARAEAQMRLVASEETNRRMSEFLGIASHEIRTPLATLKVGLQLMARAVRREGDPEATLAQVTPLIQHALLATERLEHLASEFVDASRIQAGAFHMTPTALDLDQAVRECVEEQQLLHPNRTISLDATDAPVIVRADAAYLWQVITSYLTNALKFSEDDTAVSVLLETDGPWAVVSVHDLGPGIPPDDQARVWDRFYRAPEIAHRSGSSEGFGLGLYISKSIIEQLGGEVGVKSAPGEGSTFWFKLPLCPGLGDVSVE
jgi:signal transduction histidine kinase